MKVFKIKNLLLFLLFLTSGCSTIEYASSVTKAVIKSEFVSEKLDGEQIHYYYLRNREQTENNRVIFYFTGTGCHSVGYILSNQLKLLSQKSDVIAVQKQGVKQFNTGNNCSKEFIDHEALSIQISRAKRIIHSVLSKKQYSQVIFYGSSEGAIIASLLAKEFNEVTHLVIDVFDVSLKAQDVLTNVYKSQGREKDWHDITAKLKNTNISQDKSVYENGRRLDVWRELLAVNPLTQYFEDYKLPVLLILAEKDKKIPVSSYIKACLNLKQTGSEHLLDIRILKGADHSLNPYQSEVQLEIIDWLNMKTSDGRHSLHHEGIYQKKCK